jgi:hypothetical protein
MQNMAHVLELFEGTILKHIIIHTEFVPISISGLSASVVLLHRLKYL